MSRDTEHRMMSTGLAIVLGTLLVWGVVVFRQHAQTDAAKARAEQLVGALRSADLSAPPQGTIVRLLGVDGGAVCATSGSDVARGLLKLSLFVNAGSPGGRPVLLSSALLKGGELIVRTYCPEQLASYQQFLSELRYQTTVDSS